MKVTNHSDMGDGRVCYNSINLDNSERNNQTLLTMSALLDKNKCSLSLNLISLDNTFNQVESSFTINDYIISDSLPDAVLKFVMSHQQCSVFGSLKVSDSMYVTNVINGQSSHISIDEVMREIVTSEEMLPTDRSLSNGYPRGDSNKDFLFSLNREKTKPSTPRPLLFPHRLRK